MIYSKYNKNDNLIIEAANNEYYSNESNNYLDLRSGLWNTNLGNSPDYFDRVKYTLNKYIEKNLFYIEDASFTNPILNSYSKKLINFINNKSETYTSLLYTTSGSEGCEIALKICQDINDEFENDDYKVIILKNSYHGTTIGAYSLSDKLLAKNKNYASYDNRIVIDIPRTQESLNNIKEIINNCSGKIIAAFIEPIQGSAGSQTIDIEVLEKINILFKNHGITVVYDEVSTGFYRTGVRSISSVLVNKPNIIILSKAINNGILPMGAVLLDDNTQKLINETNFLHFSTQSGNLACVTTADVTLDYYIENESKIVSNVNEIQLLFEELSIRYNINISGRGAMYSIPINDFNKVTQLEKYFQGIGILIFKYNNTTDNSSGLTIYPSLLIDISRLNISLNFIFKKVSEIL